MAAKDSGSIEVKFGGAVARVKQRGDGLWVVRWREAGKGRNTTAVKKEKALELARSTVKRLSGSQGGRMLTAEDAELVTRLKALAGERSPFAVLSQLEDATRRLGGWEALARALAFYEQSGMARVERVTMLKAKNRFLDLYDDKAQFTRAGVRKELAAFAEAHPDLCVCELTTDLLQAWVARGKPAPRFHNNRLATWRTFLNRCRSWNYWPRAEKHPAEMIEKQVEPRHAVPILTPEQAEAVLKILPRRQVPYWVMGCWLGLRPFELTRLTWDAFDWQRGYLQVGAHVARKTMEERFVPLNAKARALLQSWEGAQGKCCLIHDREEISKLARASGILETWPQDVMRHSYISYRIALGHSKHEIAEAAGNSEGVIRRRYRRPLMREDGEKWFGQ